MKDKRKKVEKIDYPEDGVILEQEQDDGFVRIKTKGTITIIKKEQ